MVRVIPDSLVIPLAPLRTLHRNQSIIWTLLLLDEHIERLEHANGGQQIRLPGIGRYITSEYRERSDAAVQHELAHRQPRGRLNATR